MIEIQKIIDIAIEAGTPIIEIYNSDDFNVEIKSDNSPLTRADLAAHNLIKEKLLSLYPSIPILSEEGKDISYEERKNWDCYWLVDPLDGTKEFIKKNGEFTVNIAFIENNEPTLGIIYAPAYNN
ncbi:MAG: 3'(2'),5'-bisphosphate nucleotidase CysQ, partial [Ignavibacteriaceae bacterium]